jgi:aldehyde dehydrogenase (NAD+)
MVNIHERVKRQKTFYQNQKTRPLTTRINLLKRLKKVIEKHEEEILEALYKDLNKSRGEAYLTEIGVIYHEITQVIKKLPKWSKNKRVSTPITHMPGKSYIISEPYGVTLIISPWNYPFQLTMAPLIGAIAGGNTVVIKPSEYSFHTAQVIYKICHETFDEDYVSVILGGTDVSQALLEERFDYIFFTGSVEVGKIVMEAASKYLTPVTLELGGKSPAIVTNSANLDLAAKRIVFGKLVNAGQTCVAPDYILVDEMVKEPLVEKIKACVKAFYGDDVIQDLSYPKIINEKHFNRIMGYINESGFSYGGNANSQTLKIAPTLLEDVKLDDPVMTEEIFGPVLPIITYKNLNDALKLIHSKEKPLALYLFTEEKEIERLVIEQTSFGGGCVNDTIMHVAHKYLPFGGVGYSGMGAYHGKASFDTFTHKKSIYKKSKWLDINLRYPPFTETKVKLIRRFLK